MTQPTVHLGHLIRRAQQIHSRMWASEVSATVTSPQIQLLAVLATSPDIDQRTATRLAKLDRSSGAELIERLSRHGYLERRRDQSDGRRYLLRLSPTGVELLEQVRGAARTLHEELLSLVPAASREQFLQAFVAFVEAGEERTALDRTGLFDADALGAR